VPLRIAFDPSISAGSDRDRRAGGGASAAGQPVGGDPSGVGGAALEAGEQLEQPETIKQAIGVAN
jgi:hypothetical protein